MYVGRWKGYLGKYEGGLIYVGKIYNLLKLKDLSNLSVGDIVA